MWEEVRQTTEVQLCSRDQVLDLCEVFTVNKIARGRHKHPWGGGGRQAGRSFVAEGFTRWTGRHFMLNAGQWRRAGAEDENFLNSRAPHVYHNDENRPSVNLTTSIYVDASMSGE